VRILLDESLPQPLGRTLVGHEVSTVGDEGWTSLTNGALLREAALKFDVLLTADQNIEFQQNLATLPMAVIVLVATSNRLESLEPLVPRVLDVLRQLPPRTLLRVGA
jgi:hypothetical protein